MIIKNKDIKEFVFDPIKVKELFKKNDDSISFAEIKLSGTNSMSKNLVSDVFYYIVEGSGKFFINKIEHQVEAGDLLIIPKNTEYYDEGDMKMFSISTPAFNNDKIEYID